MQSYRDDFFAWEQCKLKNKAEIIRGASPRPISNPKWFDDNSNVGWLRISDVTEQKGRIHHLSQRISKAGQSKTRVITEPHLLLSIAATVGSPVINYVNTGVHDGFLIFLNPTFDKEFMFQWLLMFKPYWNKYGQPGSQVNLNSDIVGNQSVAFPTMSEQERIANFFSELDTAITLHEGKKRQLERLKSALLQKMFADKSRYPAVRFEGFSDEWKTLTLSSLATMHARIGWQNLRTSEFLSHGKYMLITGTDFKNGQINFSTCHYVEKERYEQDKHIQIKNGSILITKDGTLGKVAYVQGLSKPATLNAGIFNIEIRNENEIDRTYLFQYLKAPFLMNYVQERATGGTIKHLNQSILKSFPVQVPNKIEQNKIGELIAKLDHLINLQQTKLNDIAALKNSLLQSMFI